MLDISVVVTNGTMHCNMFCVKTTIKKANYLQVSIMTSENTIKGKWSKVMMGMPKANFLLLPCPKHVQLLINIKL